MIARKASSVTWTSAGSRPSASRSRLRSGSGALHLCPSPSPAQQQPHAVRRRSVLHGVARFGQGILGSPRRARTLRRQAAYAGSVGVENELFVDITVLQ